MRCEAGDMAVIIAIGDHAPDSPMLRNIGVFVDVLHRAPVDEELAMGEQGWHVKGRSPTIASILGIFYKENPTGTVFFFPDRMLQPIRPPGIPKEVSTPEELGAFTI